MKEVIQSIPSSFQQKGKQKNIFSFFRFASVLVVFVIIYMNIFRSLMGEERGVEYVSWVESFYGFNYHVHIGIRRYWFLSEGRLFSMIVMFTGVFYLFIVLPFVFMEFLYKPFMEYQTGSRVSESMNLGKKTCHIDPL